MYWALTIASWMKMALTWSWTCPIQLWKIMNDYVNQDRKSTVLACRQICNIYIDMFLLWPYDNIWKYSIWLKQTYFKSSSKVSVFTENVHAGLSQRILFDCEMSGQPCRLLFNNITVTFSNFVWIQSTQPLWAYAHSRRLPSHHLQTN